MRRYGVDRLLTGTALASLTLALGLTLGSATAQ